MDYPAYCLDMESYLDKSADMSFGSPDDAYWQILKLLFYLGSAAHLVENNLHYGYPDRLGLQTVLRFSSTTGVFSRN